MSINGILVSIDAEIETLQQARALLAEEGSVKKKSGRPAAVKQEKKKRNLSPEGRARIAAAVKARWEAQRNAAKSE